MRQVVLDTETTGLNILDGHRIIEIGCVELLDRRLTGKRFHEYLKPDREIDQGAIEVHGITNESLQDKPIFAEIADEFISFIRDSELIIHNAPFDVGFLNRELELAGGEIGRLEEICSILDTLELARHKHPGQRNTLDALCTRYEVDNSGRSVHGALLDAELLALAFLAMTGGQGSLFQQQDAIGGADGQEIQINRIKPPVTPLKIIRANEEEQAAHEHMLNNITDSSGGSCVWRTLD